MLTRIKKSAGTGGGGTWTEFTETKGSGTGQGRNVTFTIGLKVKSGYGNVKKPPNIAAKYDAIINYADSSVYHIPSANFWTTETTAQANFSFVNPYPSKTVTSITVKWFSYSSTATTCTLTYLGGTLPVISSITGNPIELTLANAQRAKQVMATYTPKQDLHGYSKPWAGGAGRNILQFLGTHAPRNGITGTETTDDAGNVHFYLNGANTGSNTFINLNYSGENLSIPPGTWTVSVDASNSRVQCYVYVTRADDTLDSYIASYDDPKTFTVLSTDKRSYCRVQIPTADTAQFTDYEIKFMIRNSDDPDSTYEPYSNICPITKYSTDRFIYSGKNMIPMELASIKSRNTSGAWAGNIYNWRGIDFEPLLDSDGRIVSIHASGTATGSAYLNLGKVYVLASKTYQLSGCPSGGSSTKWRVACVTTGATAYDNGSGATLSPTSDMDTEARVYVYSGNTVDFYFYPMLRLSSISDATFEPYLGADQTINFAEPFAGGLYYGGGAVQKTYAEIASYNAETITEPWLSSLDEYQPGTRPTTGAQVVYPNNGESIQAESIAINMPAGSVSIYSLNADDITLSYEE